MSTSGGRKAVLAALGANGAIAVSKFVAWLFTGSSSMLAEAMHAFADSANQARRRPGGQFQDPTSNMSVWAMTASLTAATAPATWVQTACAP